MLLAATGSVATIKLVQLAELLLQVRRGAAPLARLPPCLARARPTGHQRRARLQQLLPGLVLTLCPSPPLRPPPCSAQFADVKVIATKSAGYFFAESDLPQACRLLLGEKRAPKAQPAAMRCAAADAVPRRWPSRYRGGMLEACLPACVPCSRRVGLAACLN